MKVNNRKFVNRYLALLLASLVICIFGIIAVLFLRYSNYKILFSILFVLSLYLILTISSLKYFEVNNSGQLLSIKKFHPFSKRKWQNNFEMPFEHISSVDIMGARSKSILVIVLKRTGKPVKILKYEIVGLTDDDKRSITSSCETSITEYRKDHHLFKLD